MNAIVKSVTKYLDINDFNHITTFYVIPPNTPNYSKYRTHHANVGLPDTFKLSIPPGILDHLKRSV